MWFPFLNCYWDQSTKPEHAGILLRYFLKVNPTMSLLVLAFLSEIRLCPCCLVLFPLQPTPYQLWLTYITFVVRFIGSAAESDISARRSQRICAADEICCSSVRSHNVRGYSTCTKTHYDLLAVLQCWCEHQCVRRELERLCQVRRSGLTLLLKLSAQEVVCMFLTCLHILHPQLSNKPHLNHTVW